MAHDVFDFDDGVVDQDADHQRHREQGHDIEREAHHVHRGKGRHRRQRQGSSRNKGGPAVAQEEPDDQHGEYGTFDEQLHRAFIVFDDRVDEIEGFGDLDIRMIPLQFFKDALDVIRHLDLARPLAAGNFETDHRIAVEQRGGALFADGIADRRHLIETDAPTIGQHDVHVAEFIGALDGSDGAYRLLDAANIGPATRSLLLDPLELARDVCCRCIQGQHPGRVEFNADFARHPAHPRYGTDATRREQGLGHGIVDKPRQRLVIHPARCHGVGQDRGAGEVDLADHRVAQIAGQVSADARDGIADVVDRFLRRLFQAEFDGHRRRAVLHLRVDVLNALQRRHRILDLARHLGFHLRRRRAGQAGSHRHRRQFDVHELLDLHRLEAHDAGQREEQEEQDGRRRIADRPRRNVQHGKPSAAVRRNSTVNRKKRLILKPRRPP